MTADELRALQAPLKEKYRLDPASAVQQCRAEGELDVPQLACRITPCAANRPAGLHPAAGGDGTLACSGDMLLESLVACAGVTLCAVATAMQIDLRGGTVVATGEMDFRGTLGVDRQTPVGLTEIRLAFRLDTDAPDEQLDKLIQLTERYCVVYQTLAQPPQQSSAWERP